MMSTRQTLTLALAVLTAAICWCLAVSLHSKPIAIVCLAAVGVTLYAYHLWPRTGARMVHRARTSVKHI